MKLSLELLQEPIEGRERFPEDKFFTSLEKKVYDWSSIDFSNSINECREIISEVNFILKTEDIKMFSEDWRSVINRIWEAIKNFFKKLGSILMFWKKKVNNYFNDKVKELDELNKVAKKCSIRDEYDIEKLDKSVMTIFLPKNTDYDETQYKHRFSENERVVAGMSFLLDHLKTYINDPEQNNKAKLIELEKSEDPESFRVMLGVELISNEKEDLAPSRYVVKGVVNQYDQIKTGSDITFSNLINIEDSRSFSFIEINISELLTMAKEINEIKKMIDSMEKSYEEINKGLKWKYHTNNSPDLHVSQAKTSAVVRAKDHISKSKILIEEFIKLFDIQCNNASTVLKHLVAAKKS